jgi:chromosomal replication initiator protein
MLPKINDIIELVEEFYGFSDGAMIDKDRSSTLSEARQIAMYLCHTLTERSYPEIGDALHRHHSTIIHGVRNIKSRLKKEMALQLRVNEFRDALITPAKRLIIEV